MYLFIHASNMYICMHACKFVCTRMYVSKNVCVHICVHACMYLCMYVYTYICTYVRMYVCMYVYTYACMYVYVCVCISQPGCKFNTYLRTDIFARKYRYIRAKIQIYSRKNTLKTHMYIHTPHTYLELAGRIHV